MVFDALGRSEAGCGQAGSDNAAGGSNGPMVAGDVGNVLAMGGCRNMGGQTK